MYGVMPKEFLRQYQEQEEVGCRNGAYQGKAVFEGEAFADQMIADERRWRENIDRGIEEIKQLRKRYDFAKKNKFKHLMRQLEEDIVNRKEELKEIIESRDYIY